eukprot:TRINITY_DN14891_c0_g1_i1.p1 TRINITY_DN14891_c0_g1~~TRINITY_DN14891_c0_g1_i1.p1  ORF type:complete len:585 (+),score=101.71 TRINITY_DN14891_c0_g1_i1:110-1756(+)
MRVSSDKNEDNNINSKRKRASKVFGDQKEFIESHRGQGAGPEAPTPIDWQRASHVRTKTALDRERKQGLAPHPSYDIDGDGVVSAYDFFIASKFDWDRDGRLNTAERRNVDDALAHGFTERMEQAHALQKSTIGGRLFKSLYLGNDDDDDAAAQSQEQKVTRSKLMETRKMELMQDLAAKYQPRRQKQFDAFEARKAKKPSTSHSKDSEKKKTSRESMSKEDESINKAAPPRPPPPPLYSTRSELLAKRKERDIQDYEEKQRQHAGVHKTRHERVMELEEERIAYRMAAPRGRTYRDVVRERKAQGAQKYIDLDARNTAHGASEDREALEHLTMQATARTTGRRQQQRRRRRTSQHVAEDPFKDHRGPSLHAQKQHTSRVGPVGMMRAPAPELRLPTTPSATKSFRNTGFSTDLLNRKRMQKFLTVEPKQSNVPFEIDVTGSGGMFSSFSDDKVFHPPQLPKLDERNQAVSLAKLQIARRHRQQQSQSFSLDPQQQESTVDRPYTAPIAPDEDDIRRMSMLSTPRERQQGVLLRHGGFQTLRALGKIY